MEKYIYYSIFVFSILIVLLYLYLIYEKLLEAYSFKKRKIYEKDILPFLDKLFMKLADQDANFDEINKIKTIVKNKIKRQIIIDRIIYYNANFSGAIRKRISKLCEDSALVDYNIKELKKKDYFKVALACKNLGEFRSKRAVEPLLKLVNVKFLDVRYHALMALAKIGDFKGFIDGFSNLDDNYGFSERSLTEIIDSYEGDKRDLYEKMINLKNISLSTIFIKSAGNYMDLQLSEAISRYLKDENKERRIAAIKSIGQIADLRFIEEILDGLSDSEWEVRAAAARSLGRFEDDKALDPLIEALSDSSWWVRFNAANAVIKINRGINRLQEILSSEDRFAKDIIISVLEESGVLQDLFLYEHSINQDKKRLALLLKEYVLSKIS